MKSNRGMIVTTTSTLEGWKIEAYLGTVSTHIVAGTGFFSDLFASFSDVFGGRSESYQKQLTAIHDDAIEKLKQKATSIGANAIVGLRIDHDEISGKDKQMFMVTAIGTAIRVSKSGEGQEEERKEYQVIGQDDFSSLVRRRQIVRLAREGGLILDENTWRFLKENQVHEVVANISATLRKFYEKEFLDENDRAFIKHSKEYFSSLSDEVAKKYLYNLLTLNNGASDYAFDLIGKLDLFDIDRIKELLHSDDFKVQKRALQFLRFDKPSYTPTDVEAFESLLPIIESRFQPRGERITEKGLLSSKVKELWKCVCGAKVEADREYCYQCFQNIYGFKENQIDPHKAKELISDRITVLKEVFGT